MRRGRLLETAIFGLFLVITSLLLSLLSYNPTDPGWAGTHTGYEHASTINLIGRYGAFTSDFLYSQFGWAAYLFLIPLGQALHYLLRLRLGKVQAPSVDAMLISISSITTAFLFVAMSAAVLSYLLFADGRMPQGSGGVVGQLLWSLMADFGPVGGAAVTLMVFLISTHWSFRISWLGLASWLLRLLGRAGAGTAAGVARPFRRKGSRTAATAEPAPAQEEAQPVIADDELTAQPNIFSSTAQAAAADSADTPASTTPASTTPATEPGDEGPVPAPAVAAKAPAPKAPVRRPAAKAPSFKPPSWNLLHASDSEPDSISEDWLAQRSEDLQKALAEYGIEAEVMEVFAGPVVTRFELQPRPGFKVSKLGSIVQDVARALSVVSIRVIEVIDGKAYFGIEIPNPQRATVLLARMLAQCEDEAAKMHLPAVLGAGVAGNAVVADLSTMPHLIVSGATGAGKSVGIHAMLSSLLLRCDPTQLRLVLIDPKMLELAAYGDLPHLIAPVVTEIQQAKDALKWCCEEMDSRYRQLAEARVRDLQGYNEQVKPADKLPRILVVIDELADLMMTSGKAVEQDIARIAQKARAAGIHLILATQRPSVDVITGLIKSNVPARIAFQVASSVDSRTILDQTGAEQLLGKGDMLFLHPSRGTPVRVHGAFVGEEEVAQVVAGWKGYKVPAGCERLEQFPSGEVATSTGRRADGMQDELYAEAVQYVCGSGRVSTSSVQRHLGIGFNRAARMIEAMEVEQIVSTPNERGVRTLLQRGRGA